MYWRINGCVLLSLLLLFACGEKGTGPATVSNDDFPNTVGSQWKYVVHDSLRDQVDTLTIAIVDTVTMLSTGEWATIWTYDPTHWYLYLPSDTLYVTKLTPDKSTGKQTIKVYAFLDAEEPIYTYVVPLEVGDSWTCHDCLSFYDSSHVESIDTVETPAGMFGNVYVVKQIYNCGIECGGVHTYRVKRGVGIVQSHRLEHDIMSGPDPLVNATWELIGYSIATE